MARFGYHKNDSCRICNSSRLHSYLDLGSQPPSNAFIDPSEVDGEQYFPLIVYLCEDCGLSQLIDVVHGKDVFDDYAYLSSSSRALVAHYGSMVADMLARLSPPPGSLIVDVGANDGITLDRYPTGYRLLGVEPSSAGHVATEKGHNILPRFFNRQVAREIAAQYGPAALMTATNVCAHVDDIQDFMGGFAELLADDGVLVLEFPYLVDMIESGYFDTIYHEHLCYHALTPLTALFDRVGLRALSVQRVDIGASGPALRLYVGPASGSRPVDGSILDMLAAESEWGIRDIARYRDFSGKVSGIIKDLREMLAQARAGGLRVAAYSAPAKGNTLLNAAGFGPTDIACVAENNVAKVGKLTPGSHIPIVSDAEFLEQKFDLALLLSWNYADFFLKNSEFCKAGGKFLIPLPSPIIRPIQP